MKMTREEVKEIVVKIVEKQSDESSITEADTFKGLWLDSLDMVYMGLDIEDKFSIQTPDDVFCDKFCDVETVGELIDNVYEIVK